MEFIAFKDGELRDERYKTADVTEERLPNPQRGNRRQKTAKDYGLAVFPQQTHTNAEGIFNASPKVVEFRDILVGRTYTKKIALTNCTGKSHAFRVLPVSPRYREILHYEYRPPPKLSPGLSWSVNIQLTPLREEDIDTAIVFKTEQGIFLVPVRAFRRRSAISVSPERLDYGSVTFGEKLLKRITLRNDGALPATVSVGGSLRVWTETFHRNPVSETDEPVVTFNPASYTLTVGPYSTSYLDVIFSPHEDAVIDDNVEIHCDEEGLTTVKKVHVRGMGGSLPVYVSSGPEIDFGWCFFETFYCEKITVKNTTNVLTTVTPEVPSTLASSLTFSPKTVCVQAKGTSEICVYFTPKKGIDHTTHSVIVMTVRDQKAPLRVTVKARLTERGFGVSASELHYGSRGLFEEIILPLKVENLSDLPQTLGFLTLPENVKVTPYPIVTLLPREIMEFKVGVRPPTLGPYTHVVNITNEYDVSRAVQLIGCGCEYPISFSKPCIDLPACPLGGETSYATTLHNGSSTTQQFVIASPFECLRPSPSFGTLLSGENCAVVIIFTPLAYPPTQSVEEVIPFATTKRASRKGRERGHTPPLEKACDNEEIALNDLYRTWEGSSPGERWSRRHTFLLKCVVGDHTKEHVVMLQVNCTVIRPTLVACLVSRVHQKPVLRRTAKRNTKKTERRCVEQSLMLEISPGAVQQSIDFGKVSLKYRAERVLLLRHSGEDNVYLQMRPVAPFSPFTVSKPPQFTLAHEDECAVTIYFTPTEPGIYKEEVIITSSCSNDVTLYLQGSCESADLLVTSERELSDQHKSIDRLSVEPAQIGYESRQQLYFHNISSLPLEVYATFVTSDGGNPVWPEAHSFAFESEQFTILGKAKVSKTIVFTPQVQGLVSLCLRVSDGSFEQGILVEGRGCDLPVFLTFPPQKDVTDEENIPCLGLQTNLLPITGSSVIDPVRLNFTPEQVKTIYVGSVKTGGSFECFVSGWSDTFTESGWRLEPMKVSGPGGSHGTFTLSYNPKREHADTSLCAFSLVTRCTLMTEEKVSYVQCTGTI